MTRLRTVGPLVGAKVATYVVRQQAKSADAELLTPEHRAWRQAVLQRAGHRCEVVEHGKRCTRAAPHRLFADHIIERADGGAHLDPANGQCLCGRHHTIKTTQARAARLGRRG